MLKTEVCAGCHTTRLEAWPQQRKRLGRDATMKRIIAVHNQIERSPDGANGSRECAPDDERNCARAVMTGSAKSGAVLERSRIALRFIRATGEIVMVHTSAISRRIPPEVCNFVALLLNRGRREDRVLAAPAVSRASAHGKSAHEHTGTGGASRPSLRSGFTAYFALFPENGSFASVACASYRKLSASTAAPEPRDFAVRIRRVRLARLPRPPHPTARS